MDQPSSRRQFLAGAALVPLAATLPEAAQAQDKPEDAQAAVAQALTDIVRRRFGKHLSDDQIKFVQAAIRGDQASALALRGVRLENSDEPDFVFAAEVE